MANVIPLEEFKILTKPLRTQYLKGLRMVYSDKEIRDSWGLKYDAFDYHLKALGLKDMKYGKKVEPDEQAETTADRLRKKAGKVNSKNNNIIELEYKVVKEDAPITPEPQQQLALEAPRGVSHMISYPSVVGNVAQLRKRLEAILTLVELEGEDVELVLGITIDRK